MKTKVINPALAALKKGDVFRFAGQKKIWMLDYRQNNKIYVTCWHDIGDWKEISKFTPREIETDFDF